MYFKYNCKILIKLMLSGDNNAIQEVSVYFDDIIRNKDMIKEMFKTNILVYEDKVKANNEKLAQLKEDLARLGSEFSLVENKLKLEYAKNHDNFQKHDINFKLLDKTHTHYKMLIRDREEEIKKIEEQTIFAYQDYQNKKIKLDCVNVQIVEAEFQLETLKKKMNEHINNMIDIQKDDEENEDLHFRKSNSSNENVEKVLSERMAYRSGYATSIGNSKKNKFDSVASQSADKDLFDTMTMNGEGVNRNKCLIF